MKNALQVVFVCVLVRVPSSACAVVNPPPAQGVPGQPPLKRSADSFGAEVESIAVEAAGHVGNEDGQFPECDTGLSKKGVVTKNIDTRLDSGHITTRADFKCKRRKYRAEDVPPTN